ncbi:MAG: HlyD family efflux transporter periplasmic adaptor subunit [Chloroflexi bacterium]|nr:HlyD family efflux transporter periplasmic adaptor subunit [Chloroflexota bacterium]
MKQWMILCLVVLLLVAGCGQAPAEEPESEEIPPVVSQAADQVVAEAVIEPDRWSELRFDIGGDVAEVLVQEGDVVAVGDVLLVLETAKLERAVAQAKFNLNQAELRLSQAELRLSQAELRLEQLEQPSDDADIRRAEHAITQAAATLEVAQLNVTTLLNNTLFNEALEDAQELYDDMRHRYEVRVERYESGKEPDYWYVDQAQERMDDAKLDLDRVQQQGNLQSRDARSEVQRAQQSYREAQDALDLLLEEADILDVKVMQQDIEAARVETEAAHVDIESSQLSLEEASSNLEDATLRAPFMGTVTTLNVDVGETVSQGEVAFVLATLDQLLARTVDLTELDVARVTEGQSVVVTVDALPDAEFGGHVIRIGLQAVDYRGDVTYPVYVELDDAAPELRWGMTAMVEIETD